MSSVAEHYDRQALEKQSDRDSSRIIKMRKFNNWTKSVLLGTFLRWPGAHVLDIAAGKGGDLSKFERAKVASWTAVDISPASIAEAARRYSTPRGGRRTFAARFLVADCTSTPLWSDDATAAMAATAEAGREEGQAGPGAYASYPPDDARLTFDLVSCQFALHYAFITEEAARMFLANVTERMEEGAYFVGSIVDARVLKERLVASSSKTGFGNDIYSVKPTPDTAAALIAGTVPPFGAEYHFWLDGVVDCAEYVLDFDVLIALCEEFGLQLAFTAGLLEFYEDHKGEKKFKPLLHKFGLQHPRSDTLLLSPEEIEALSLYMVFGFQKPGLLKLELPPTTPIPYGPYPQSAIHNFSSSA